MPRVYPAARPSSHRDPFLPGPSRLPAFLFASLHPLRIALQRGSIAEVPYLVFAQLEEPVVPVDTLRAQARAHFDAEISRIEDGSATGGALRIAISSPLGTAELAIEARAATEDDRARALAAEARGHAAGMAALAARCPTVFVVRPRPHVQESQVLELCAVLALVGLGPILPPDGSTLLGVRSARHRAGR